MKSVHCAVRTGSLNKQSVLRIKGLIVLELMCSSLHFLISLGVHFFPFFFRDSSSRKTFSCCSFVYDLILLLSFCEFIAHIFICLHVVQRVFSDVVLLRSHFSVLKNVSVEKKLAFR